MHYWYQYLVLVVDTTSKSLHNNRRAVLPGVARPFAAAGLAELALDSRGCSKDRYVGAGRGPAHIAACATLSLSAIVSAAPVPLHGHLAARRARRGAPPAPVGRLRATRPGPGCLAEPLPAKTAKTQMARGVEEVLCFLARAS